VGKLYVAAPEGQQWPMDLDAAEASLRQHWPDIRLSRPTSAVNGQRYLSFDVVVDGAARYGTYADRFCLTLAEGSPQVWADTIVWFLGLLPAGTAAVAMAEEDPERIVPVPPAASAEQIRELYEGLAGTQPSTGDGW
jgi:hypothetical protein